MFKGLSSGDIVIKYNISLDTDLLRISQQFQAIKTVCSLDISTTGHGSHSDTDINYQVKKQKLENPLQKSIIRRRNCYETPYQRPGRGACEAQTGREGSI